MLRQRPDSRRRLIWIVLATLTVAGMARWVVEPVRVTSDSMAPALRSGDQAVIDKITYLWRDPRPGEIVTASDPLSSGWIVKRVVAVGGDSIGIEDGVLFRNERPLIEPYADQSNMAGVYFGPIAVPPGHVFLLGDNRSMSIDSRTFGPVPIDELTGRVVLSW